MRPNRSMTPLFGPAASTGKFIDAVFTMAGTFVQNLAHYIIFSNDELHIILQHRNLEIGKYWSVFLKLLTKLYPKHFFTSKIKLGVPRFKITKLSL